MAGILDHVARGPAGPDCADQGQGIVLGPDARRRLALEDDPHVPRLGLAQGLGRQHMLDLRGADALSQRPEGAVCGGVGIAADDGHPRLGAALLGPDHVDDAVALIAHGEELDAMVGDVARQGGELQARLGVGDRSHPPALADRWHIVVGHRQGELRPPHRPARSAEPGERLRRRHFMNEVQVYVDDRLAALAGPHQVRVPDLVVEGPAGHEAPM